ncbi:XRE family transcriptional regulator [Streptomyces sp. NBC_00124]|uniref:nSTAND1 domain-containing NTPase n=1 Tax=Streptomyces sp. NBC_00124 TaxID=2975662 RepID=UPI0022553530|nr:XRE family transcriptional regulator [Streptomyces sp. NBC_00124]MCX5357693.1 XRE family transcriptional regulator [Streptomyces sp. NBC_00124]
MKQSGEAAWRKGLRRGGAAMPRKERPIDDDGGPLSEFAAGLRKLRRDAGNPPYRALAEQAHYSISTLSSAASGQRLPTLAVTLAYVRACDGDVREWEQRWRSVAKGLDAEHAASDPAEESAAPPPYAGLRSFTEREAEWFFGREQLVEELTGRLQRQRFVVVIGASGSGKSSLLRAGLVPRLQVGATVVVLTPGTRPLEECAVRLGALSGLTPGALYGELKQDRDNLGRVVRQIVAGSQHRQGQGVVLVVDQFEETFTLCRDDAERRCFIAALVTAASAPSGECRVVVGVRADFYAHCTHHPHLVEAMRDAQVPVGPMSLDELRRAVVSPAQRAGLTVEGALLASLTAQAQGQAGMLPLLSHALLQTWRRRRGNALTLQAFEAVGGLEGGLARTAEDFYQQLEARQRELARRVFVRLTALGEGTEDTRRPTRLQELEGLTEQTDGGDIAAMLDRAAGARLLTLDHERVELAHEALIRCWPRLHGWLTDDREATRALRQLTEATHTWETLGQDPGALYRGTRLAMAAALDRSALSAGERAFLDASLADAQRQQAAARRSSRRLRRLIALLTVLLFLASATTIYALRAQDDANRQRNIALSQKVAQQAAAVRSANPALATQLSLAAYRLAPTAEARGGLLSTFATPYATRLTGHTDNVNAVAYRADSRVLVSAGNDHTVRLWDVADPHRPRVLAVLTGHTDKVSHAAFSPDGRTLATASWDDTTRLWDTTAPDRPRPRTVLRSHTGDVNAVAFSPDGRTLATAGTDGTVRLWDLTDADHPRVRQTLPGRRDAKRAVLSVAFSPDGRTLASAVFDNSVRLWTLGTSAGVRPVAVLTGHTAAVSWLVFGPDGRTLASASWDRTVRLWDLSTPRRPARSVTLKSHSDSVRSVAISPDGRTLATASMDHTVGVWDIDDPHHPVRQTVLTGHTDAAVFVAFSPDGRTLASAGDDQTARLWDLPLTSAVRHTATICATAFAPDGRTLATAGDDRAVRLWRLTDPRRPRKLATLTGHKDAVCGLALSPDGYTLATGSWDGTIRLWDITDPSRPHALATTAAQDDHVNTAAFRPDGRVLATTDGGGAVRLWSVTDLRRPRELAHVTGHTGGANTAVFSPDGHTLATGGWDGTVRLWDVTDPRRPGRLGISPVLEEGVNAAAFSPDGDTLATTDFGDTVRLWHLTDRRLRETTPLVGHVGSAHSPLFSPDGHTLVTTGSDGTVRLWDLTDSDHPRARAALTNDGPHLYTAAFHPDGHTLVTAGADRTAQIWESDPERVAARVCKTSHPTMSRSEWKQYFGNLSYRPPCP